MSTNYNLNEMFSYIELHLDEDISYEVLAKIVGINENIFKRFFPFITGFSLNEYIRKRRLSMAGVDLAQNNMKIIDVAIKYGYLNATSFSRAFYKFHGVKPMSAKNKTSKLNFYPKLVIEIPPVASDMHYEIVELPAMKLYGVFKNTNNESIFRDAPSFYKEVVKTYNKLPDYGVTTYKESNREIILKYGLFWKEKQNNLEEIFIPKSRWLQFKVETDEAVDIQNVVKNFYLNFLPGTNYQLKDLPELEYYHDGVADFLIAIN